MEIRALISFDAINTALSYAPVIAFPYFDKPFSLETDASTTNPIPSNATGASSQGISLKNVLTGSESKYWKEMSILMQLIRTLQNRNQRLIFKMYILMTVNHSSVLYKIYC